MEKAITSRPSVYRIQPTFDIVKWAPLLVGCFSIYMHYILISCYMLFQFGIKIGCKRSSMVTKKIIP